MRVVSLVPSWTETLIACGVDVVGRTRFCIHPEERVKSIPVVGGTKELDVEKLRALAPDLVVLDREENTKEMAAAIATPVLVTHVRGIGDCARESKRLADVFRAARRSDLAETFEALSERWAKVEAAQVEKRPPREWPGVTEWLTEPPEDAARVCYVIWRGPWMAVTRETFIGSVLEKVGIASDRAIVPASGSSRYPEIADLAGVEDDCIFLFSSEPFPFAKKKTELAALPGAKAIVDGEVFSWFGVRALAFLERSAGIRVE